MSDDAITQIAKIIDPDFDYASDAVQTDIRELALECFSVVLPSTLSILSERDALNAKTQDLLAHISEMRSTIEWMVALIDGGEQMPKPGDEIHEALALCLANTKDLRAAAAALKETGNE